MKRHLAPVLLLLGVAGCSGSSESAAPAPSGSAVAATGKVVVTATDRFRFEPSHLRVPVGVLAVTLVGTGSYPHTFSVPRLGQTSDTVRDSLGEQRTTLRLRFEHPGTYRFLCTYHDQAGMTGVITVY